MKMKKNAEPKPKVVVADDDKDFLRLVARWLKDDYRVECLPGGAGLTDEISALEPDLVLLDAHMPGENGFAVCRRLRSRPGLAELPIVFLTGSRTDEDFLQHLDTGGSRYLNKPIGRRALLAALSEMLGQAV
jgi:CheY-like chemotaxis protein